MTSLTGMRRKALILSMLGRLKQICDHPALYLKEEQTEPLAGRSVKLEKLLELMTAIRAQNESQPDFHAIHSDGEHDEAVA